MKENVMKSTRLFKQALLITAVSSLALGSAIAMENEKENPNHSTITQKLGEWNEAVKSKNVTKLQDLCEKGLTKTTQTNIKEEANFEKLIWENRSERLTQVLFADRKEGEEIDYSPLIDYFEEPVSSNNTFPTVTNPQLLKGEEKNPEPQPQLNFISLENKDEETTVNNSTTVNTNLYLTVNNKNVTHINTNIETNSQMLQQFQIEDKKEDKIVTVVPQKTSKEIWEEDGKKGNHVKRFELMIKGLCYLWQTNKLPSVEARKENGTWDIIELKPQDVKFTSNVTVLDTGSGSKDKYMYAYVIEELDNVFFKKLGIKVTDLPNPRSGGGGKKFARTYGIPENYMWSKLYYYRENIMGNNGIIKKIINDIQTNKIDYPESN
jgi:hypothetical protein